MLGSEDIRSVARNHSNATIENAKSSEDTCSCNSRPVSDSPFSHINSHCFNCIHADVCQFKDSTLRAFKDIDMILDRINVFATIQCRYYIQDQPKQIYTSSCVCLD